MLADRESKQQIGKLPIGRGAVGDAGQVARGDPCRVAPLQQEAAGQCLDGHAGCPRIGHCAGGQHAKVLFCSQNGAGVGIDVGRDDHLEKQRRHGLGGGRVECPVDRDDTAKGADRIAAQRLGVGGLQRVAQGDAARVGMLYDRHRWPVEFRDQLERRVGIVEIVVAQFLALKLLGGGDTGSGICCSVERRRLMRIFPIAHNLRAAARIGEAAGEGIVILSGKPRGNGGIVGSGARIGGTCQLFAERRIRRAVIVGHCGHDRVIIRRIGDDGDAFMVLGGGPDQRRSADIDVFDAGLEIAAAGDSRFERIKVDHYQIDGRDAVRFHGGHMRRVGAACEYAAMDQRMQGFDPPIHDLGETGMVPDLLDRHARGSQRRRGAAGGQNFNVVVGKKPA